MPAPPMLSMDAGSGAHAFADAAVGGEPVTFGLVTDAADARDWDEYVDACATASVYHRTCWASLVTRVFGHATYYLFARNSAGRMVGVLPMVRLRSRMFGDYVVSMPYFNYGGAVGDSAEVERALMVKACGIAEELGSRHIEFRDRTTRDGDWALRTDKVVMELALPASVEDLWKCIGTKMRAQIKRPQREAVECVAGGSELLDDFYAVFARNMRDLGTPVYARRFFAEIMMRLPDSTFIVVVRYQGRPVAAGFLIGDKQRLEIPWASSLREFNAIGVNMLLYWEVLKRAIERGYKVFDFGRSTPDSGTYRFKKQWGARERQLYWHYWLRPGKELPRLTPDNPKYRMAIRIWRRLPLFIVNRLGPAIVKNLP